MQFVVRSALLGFRATRVAKSQLWTRLLRPSLHVCLPTSARGLSTGTSPARRLHKFLGLDTVPGRLILIGNLIITLQWSCNDVLAIRSFAVTSNALMLLIFSRYNPQPVFAAFQALFLSINVFSLAKLTRDKMDYELKDPRLREMYKTTFEGTLTKRKMEDFLSTSEFVRVRRGSVVFKSDEEDQSLILVCNGAVEVTADGLFAERFSAGHFFMPKEFDNSNLVGATPPHCEHEGTSAEEHPHKPLYKGVAQTDEVGFFRWSEAAQSAHKLSHEDTNALLKRHLDMRSLCRQQSVGSAAYRTYQSILAAVLADGQVTRMEDDFLRDWRERRGISDKFHVRALGLQGWSVEKYNDCLTTTRPAAEAYLDLLRIVIADGVVDPKEREFLEQWRVVNGISDEEHAELLLAAGWTCSSSDGGGGGVRGAATAS